MPDCDATHLADVTTFQTAAEALVRWMRANATDGAVAVVGKDGAQLLVVEIPKPQT